MIEELHDLLRITSVEVLKNHIRVDSILKISSANLVTNIENFLQELEQELL